MKAGLPNMWIMDTGCGFDLISKAGLSTAAKKKIKHARQAIRLQAAGGSVKADMILPLHSPALKRDVEPLVLSQTPSVLSLGRRCMDEGFSFWWESGKFPIITLPDGKQIELYVIDYIPYLQETEGQKAAIAVPAPAARLVAGSGAFPPAPAPVSEATYDAEVPVAEGERP